MSGNRGEFSSRIAFILAAAGSAIGLGNIWGFPGQTATNGGAAFVLVYLVLAFIIAYPAFMAELIIGRHSNSNIVGAFSKIEGGKNLRWVGFAGLICAGMILSFYTVIAGWMFSYVFEAIFRLLGLDAIADWTISGDIWRNLTFTVLFALLNMSIVMGGVKDGLEKWSTRLMPMLIVMLLTLIIYVLSQDGAMEGLKVYLIPDFSKVTDSNLVLSALGQAFFSLSLGVGTMLVYGSYISKKENLPELGALVTLADVGIAFMAGLLIIPAMYVAQAQGVQIYDASGALIAGPNLVFQVLPGLFNPLGLLGIILSLIFFSLMTIAAVTSSISMLEVPVAYAVDDRGMDRKKATWIFGCIILLVSLVNVWQNEVFNLIVMISTQYMEPIIGMILCLFIGWIMNRNSVLNEIKEGYPEAEYGVFWKIWPLFVKVICPILIIVVFINSVI